MSIQIEKNVPIPKKALGRGKDRLYPFDKMEVGDSFTAPNPKDLPLTKLRNQVNAAANHFSKNNNTKFTIRVIEGEVKVWRTE